MFVVSDILKEMMDIIVTMHSVHSCYLDESIDVWQSIVSADCKCTVIATIVIAIFSYKNCL